MTTGMDRIGIAYVINMGMTKNSINSAKTEFKKFHDWIETSSKKAGDKLAPESANQQLKKLGVTSRMTSNDIKGLKLSTLELQRVFDLTKQRMKELTTEVSRSGKATKAQSAEFTTLQKRMPELEHAVNSNVKAFGDYRRAMDRWGAGFKYMIASQAAWIASGMLLFGTLQTISQGFKDVVQFHQDMKMLQAITGATTEEIQKMDIAIRTAAVKTKFFAAEMAKAATIMGQAGFSADEVADSIGAVALLASATGRGLEDVADLMTTVIRAYELSAGESLRVVNVLAAGISNSKLQIEDLKTAFNYMGVAANQFNISIEETVAWLGVLRDRGMKATTIGTSFRGVLATLVKETDKFGSILKKLPEPLGFADITIRRGRSLEDALERLSKAGFRMTDAFRALPRRTAMTFGLMADSVETMKALRKEITGTSKAIEMNEITMQGMQSQLAQTKSIFDEFMISMTASGSNMEPFITTIKTIVQIMATSLMTIGMFTKMLAKSLAAMLAIAEIPLTKAGRVTGGAKDLFKGLWNAKTGEESIKAMEEAEKKAKGFFKELLSDYPVGKTGAAQITEILKKLEDDFAKDLKATDAFIKRIGADWTAGLRGEDGLPFGTPKNRGIEKIYKDKESLQALYTKKDAIKELMKTASGKGLEKLEDDLILVNAQIKELEISLLGVNDALLGPVSNLQDIMLGKAFKTKDADSILAVFRKGKDDVKDMEFAVSELKQKYYETVKLWKEEGGFNDTELWQRVIAYAGNLTEAEKALGALKKRIANQEKKDLEEAIKLQKKWLDFSLKGYAQVQKAAEKFGAARESLDEKYAKFRNSIEKKIAKVGIDEYENQILFLKENNEERLRIIDEMLKKVEDRRDKLRMNMAANPLLLTEFEATEEQIKRIKELYALIGILHEEELKKIGKPDDILGGIKEGYRQAMLEIRNQYDLWKQMTKDTMLELRDTMSDVFFDSMNNELKTASDYWKAFTNTIKRYIADIAAQWVMSGIASGGAGIAAMASGWLGLHSGGSVQKRHQGGFERMRTGGGNLNSNEVMRVLKVGEHVIQDSSVRSVGQPALDHINRTGTLPQAPAPVNNIRNYYMIDAIDPASFDQFLRTRGASAIHDVSLGSFNMAKEQRDRRVM